jgi:hypothetical protein
MDSGGDPSPEEEEVAIDGEGNLVYFPNPEVLQEEMPYVAVHKSYRAVALLMIAGYRAGDPKQAEPMLGVLGSTSLVEAWGG